MESVVPLTGIPPDDDEIFTLEKKARFLEESVKAKLPHFTQCFICGAGEILVNPVCNVWGSTYCKACMINWLACDKTNRDALTGQTFVNFDKQSYPPLTVFYNVNLRAFVRRAAMSVVDEAEENMSLVDRKTFKKAFPLETLTAASSNVRHFHHQPVGGDNMHPKTPGGGVSKETPKQASKPSVKVLQPKDLQVALTAASSNVHHYHHQPVGGDNMHPKTPGGGPIIGQGQLGLLMTIVQNEDEQKAASQVQGLEHNPSAGALTEAPRRSALHCALAIHGAEEALPFLQSKGVREPADMLLLSVAELNDLRPPVLLTKVQLSILQLRKESCPHVQELARLLTSWQTESALAFILEQGVSCSDDLALLDTTSLLELQPPVLRAKLQLALKTKLGKRS